MSQRINEKIKQIEEYLSDLLEIIPEEFKEYKQDKLIKLASERLFEKITEAMTDLAYLLIKERGLQMPEDDTLAFRVLEDSQIISKELSKRLQEAKSMRNVIAHLYGEIDDEIVFKSISEELEVDVNNFIKEVKRIK